ncbi:AI-2E family transporter [Acetobacteraceae bacterium]|nr:AI-2E family transporter [Acetobacteraceae bacterium]
MRKFSKIEWRLYISNCMITSRKLAIRKSIQRDKTFKMPVFSKDIPRLRRNQLHFYARVLLAVLIIGFTLYMLRDFLSAIVWGGILAIAFWPPYQWAREKLTKKKSSWLAALFTSLLFLAILGPLIWLLMQIADELSDVTKWLEYVQKSGISPPGWLYAIPIDNSRIITWWNTNLGQPGSLSEMFRSVNFTHSVKITRQVGIFAIHSALLFGFTFLIFFFFLRDGRAITQKTLIASRRLFGRHGETIGRQIIDSIHGTVAGLVMVALGEGVAIGIIYISAHAPQPILFGFLTAFAAMIPMLGGIFVAIVSCILLAQGHMVAAIITFFAGIIVLFIADHFIRPALIGGSTKLPFLWVLLGILGGAETWGLLGLFAGPAIMSALHLLWTIWTTDPRNKKRTFTKPKDLIFK